MDVIQVQDQFYILATSSLADDRTRVLKHGETFGVFDRYGDIQSVGLKEQGIFHEGTRFLSRLRLSLNGKRPLLLSSTVKAENDMLVIDLTNPDFYAGEAVIPRGTIYLFRSKFVWEGACYERLRVSNFGIAAVDLKFSYEFDADFLDIFEVRGIRRRERGRLLEPSFHEQGVMLRYAGRDGVTRETRVNFSPAPKDINANRAEFELALAPHQESTYFLTISARAADERVRTDSFESAFQIVSRSYQTLHSEICKISSSNETFDQWVQRSVADLSMMITQTASGPYPYAGVPWFSTAFGRDGILTAFETLGVYPGLARGVLAFLAATQAKEISEEQDAEPGKILHETRKGELAALKEIPFGLYYGSVDATPLFVVLAAEYYRRTGDRAFVERLWPSLESALGWIDRYGDKDGDGFVEYARRSPRGLVHQGWKDSEDSVFYSDGAPAEAPIALCEVQAYVYRAKLAAASLAETLGAAARARELRDEARRLREKFLQAFWSEEIGTYVLALDGQKKPCRVRTSNAGHCLFAEIASHEHARRVAEGLLRDDFFTGWGVRTLSASESRYNPMSYHNGSIWPHDNALIAYGMARYGFKDLVAKIFSGIFDASAHVDLHRLPELFCGFARRPGEGPTLYPVACAPQSWASGSIFLLLEAALGMSIDGPGRKVFFSAPYLPAFLSEVELRDLRVDDASIDLSFQRRGSDVTIHLLRKTGPVEIITTK